LPRHFHKNPCLNHCYYNADNVAYRGTCSHMHAKGGMDTVLNHAMLLDILY
jgi:hypothetical protein